MREQKWVSEYTWYVRTAAVAAKHKKNDSKALILRQLILPMERVAIPHHASDLRIPESLIQGMQPLLSDSMSRSASTSSVDSVTKPTARVYQVHVQEVRTSSCCETYCITQQSDRVTQC